jgi:PAS domain-containing protein
MKSSRALPLLGMDGACVSTSHALDGFNTSEWCGRAERALTEVKATTTVQPFEKELFRKDGSRVPVLIGAASFEESENEGVSFVLDLSEQKRAEERMVKNEERTQLMLDEALDAVVTMDVDGVATGWNTQAEVIFGWSREASRSVSSFGREPLGRSKPTSE